MFDDVPLPVDEVEIRGAALAQSNHHGFAVRGEGWGQIEALAPGDGVGGGTLPQIGDVQILIAAMVAGIGQEVAIRREPRGYGERLVAGDLARMPAEDVGDVHFFPAGAVGNKGHGGSGHPCLAGEILDQSVAESQCHVLPLGGGASEAPAGQGFVAGDVENLSLDHHPGSVAGHLPQDYIVNPKGLPVRLATTAVPAGIDDADESVQVKTGGQQFGHGRATAFL